MKSNEISLITPPSKKLAAKTNKRAMEILLVPIEHRSFLLENSRKRIHSTRLSSNLTLKGLCMKAAR